MYLLTLSSLFAVVEMLGRPRGMPIALALALYGILAALHVLAWWTERRNHRRARWWARLAVIDFGAGGVLLIYFTTLSDLRVFALDRAIAPAWWAIAAAGAALAFILSTNRNPPPWLLPVKGIWARRLCAATAILLLQVLAPSTLLLGGGPIRQSIGRAEPVSTAVFWLWILTLPLYYSPLYECLVRGEWKVPAPQPTPSPDAAADDVEREATVCTS